MVFKKMRLRNSEMGMGGLVMTILIVIGIFLAGFSYISFNATQAGVTIDEKYNETYGNFTETQKGIESQTELIQSNLEDISEATNVVQVAWNGLKGLGNTIKLTIYYINSAIGIWAKTTFAIDFVPPWAISSILAGILVFVVFVLLRLFLQGKA